jgi:hypothetical protein
MFVTFYGPLCFTAPKLSYQKINCLAQPNGFAKHLFHGNNMEAMMA